jgi:hypothetical protein
VSRLPHLFHYLSTALIALSVGMAAGADLEEDEDDEARPWEDEIPESRGHEPDIGSWE